MKLYAHPFSSYCQKALIALYENDTLDHVIGVEIEGHIDGIPPEKTEELLQAAHAVDGIVKGLPSDGWPRNGWQALRQLAMQLAQAGRA